MIVIEIFFEVFAIGEEVEKPEAVLVDFLFILTILMLEREQARATPFDLNEVRWRHDRTRENDV